MVFLFALGLVYGIAYACVNNVLVLWPVLIPISWFLNNLQSGNIDLMWAAIVGFVDVIVIMFAALWLVHRRGHRVISHVAITQPATPASRG
jgi:hypothetical protein